MDRKCSQRVTTGRGSKHLFLNRGFLRHPRLTAAAPQLVDHYVVGSFSNHAVVTKPWKGVSR